MILRTTSFVFSEELQGGNIVDTYTNLRAGEKGAYLSIVAYIFLSTLKLAFGYIGDSQALRADGLNNLTDIIASIAVLVGLRISQRPPDDDHQYGHLRAETIASLIASFVMIYVGIEVLTTAVRSLFETNHGNPDTLTIWVSLFSAVVMYAVYRYNLQLAERIKSTAVKAAAYDNRSDALVSIATAIGITAAIVGLPIIDTITAFIVGIIILKTAYDILKEAIHLLTDGFDHDILERVKIEAAHIPQVREVRDVRGRQHGSLMLLDVTVAVNPNLNVRRSHEITEEIEAYIRTIDPNALAFVHIEPYDPKEIIICEDDYHF